MQLERECLCSLQSSEIHPSQHPLSRMAGSSSSTPDKSISNSSNCDEEKLLWGESDGETATTGGQAEPRNGLLFMSSNAGHLNFKMCTLRGNLEGQNKVSCFFLKLAENGDFQQIYIPSSPFSPRGPLPEWLLSSKCCEVSIHCNFKSWALTTSLWKWSCQH